MGRAVWRGPYVAVSLLKDVIALARKHTDWWNRGRFQGIMAPEEIKTRSRSSTILPDFLRCKFGVYNGMVYIPVDVTEAMVGHRLGEFSPTKKPVVHKKKEAKGVKGKGAKK